MGKPPSSCLTQLTFMELPLSSSSPSTLGGFGFPAGKQTQDGGELTARLSEDELILLSKCSVSLRVCYSYDQKGKKRATENQQRFVKVVKLEFKHGQTNLTVSF